MRIALIACVAACTGSTVEAEPPRHFDEASGCDPAFDPGRELPDELFDYAWACTGDIAPAGVTPPPTAYDECPDGTWPALTAERFCPTVSDLTRDVNGITLPPDDERALPLQLAPQEAGSFRTTTEAAYPSRLKVVSWNLEYTASLDAQIEALTTHPQLADADVYLFSEMDRCTSRNGKRRAIREIARAIGGDYVYGVEFVELDVGREIGGDTGQAIVSRRPLVDAALTCHTSQHDWFSEEREPRLGQRIRLAADVPAGDTSVRVHAIHLESSDLQGEKRVVQAREVLDRAQLEACDRPQVISGDFNAWYCAAPELEVLRRSQFQDATRLMGDVEPTHERGFRLDMVWTRGTKVIDAGVVRGLGLSDHDPVWAVLDVD